MCRRSDHTLFTAAGNADCKAVFEGFVISKSVCQKTTFVSQCVSVAFDLPMFKPFVCTQKCVS